jgi:hypothetical protein
MYKIPTDFNLRKIENERISQIAFSLNSVSLFFNDGFIQFSGSFSLFYQNQESNYYEVYPVRTDYRLLNLLEKKIEKISVDDERTILIIKFEDEIILKLIGMKEYESYKININQKEIIV